MGVQSASRQAGLKQLPGKHPGICRAAEWANGAHSPVREGGHLLMAAGRVGVGGQDPPAVSRLKPRAAQPPAPPQEPVSKSLPGLQREPRPHARSHWPYLRPPHPGKPSCPSPCLHPCHPARAPPLRCPLPSQEARLHSAQGAPEGPANAEQGSGGGTISGTPSAGNVNRDQALGTLRGWWCPPGCVSTGNQMELC